MEKEILLVMEKPVFNDANLKEKIRTYNSFGGKVVEYLYGARDAEGNSVAPATEEDGHGRWYGIECNGEYTMFSWKHSQEEGGAVEYGTAYEDQALNQLLSDLEAKKNLCREAEVLAREYEGSDGKEKMEAVKASYDALTDWHTPKDKELNKRFEKAYGESAESFEAIATNKAAKEAVVAKLDEIKELTNFKEAQKAINDVFGELKEIGSAGAESDKSFTKMVREVEKDLNKRREEYFANLDSSREAAKAKKTEIVAQAKELAANVTNWKKASEQFGNFMDEWKKAGSAGKEADDALWKEFNAARDRFNEGKRAFYGERKEQWKEAVEKKRALIEEAKKISDTKDYSRENTQRMKELDVEWRKTGYSGKETNDALWEEFNTAKEVFWDGKKELVVQRLQGELNAKKIKLDATKKKIEDLEERVENEENGNLKEGFERELYVTKSKVETMEKEIAELEERMK